MKFRTATRADVPAILALLADDEISRSRGFVSEEVDARVWAAFEQIDADPGNRRGGGLGRAMMTYARDRAQEQGAGLIQLTTDKRRTEARRFYESLGFTASHEGMKLALDTP